MRITGGLAAAFLAVLALGGCHSDDELLIQNIGRRAVLVEVFCIYGSYDGDF